MKCPAVVFEQPDRITLRDIELRLPAAGEALVRVAFSCISPGTELHRLAGRERLGEHRYPMVPGYCLSGRVAQLGPGVTGWNVGDPVVTCGSIDAGGLHPAEGAHLAGAIVTVDRLARVAPGTDLREASASVLAGIALHGLKRSAPRPGQRVAVIGLGVIGQLSARVHAAAGPAVVACDRSRRRVALARAAGVEAFVCDGPLRDGFARHFPDGADIVVEATGVPAVLAEALTVARRAPWHPLHDSPDARLLIQGSYEQDPPLPYADAYAAQAAIHVPRGSQVGDWQAALDMLAAGTLRVADLISATAAPAQARDIYSQLGRRDGELLTAAFAWE